MTTPTADKKSPLTLEQRKAQAEKDLRKWERLARCPVLKSGPVATALRQARGARTQIKLLEKAIAYRDSDEGKAKTWAQGLVDAGQMSLTQYITFCHQNGWSL